MYGYNILYIKKINIYTLYPTHNQSKAYSHSDHTLLSLRLRATVTLITAKRHHRCALLITRVKPTLTLITR